MKTEIKLNLTDYQKEILLAILDEKANAFDNHSTKTDKRAIALDDIATQIETYKPLLNIESDKQHAIKLAGVFLCGDAENDIGTMFNLICLEAIKGNGETTIDFIDGVEVTHRYEYQFNVNEFLAEVGWSK